MHKESHNPLKIILITSLFVLVVVTGCSWTTVRFDDIVQIQRPGMTVRFDNVVQIQRLGVSFSYPSSWGAFGFNEQQGKEGREFNITFSNDDQAPLIGGATSILLANHGVRLTDAYHFSFEDCKIHFPFGGRNEIPPSAKADIKCVEEIKTSTMTTYYLRVSNRYDDSKQLLFHPNQLIGIVPLNDGIESLYKVAMIVINEDGKSLLSGELAQQEIVMKQLLSSFEKIPRKVKDAAELSALISDLAPPPPPDFSPPDFHILTEAELSQLREEEELRTRLKKIEDERLAKEESKRRELKIGRGATYNNEKWGVFLEFPADALYVASKNLDDFLHEYLDVVFCVNAPKNEKNCDLMADGSVSVHKYQLTRDAENRIPINENFMRALCKVHACRSNDAMGEVVTVDGKTFFKQEPQIYYAIKDTMLYQIVFDDYGTQEMINQVLEKFKPKYF